MSIARVLNAPARPVSMWVTNAVVLAYALWTVVCHVVMLAGGNVRHLTVAVACVFGAALIGGGALAVRQRRRSRSAAAPAPAPAPAPEPEAPAPEERTDLRSTVILSLLASVTIGLWVALAKPLVFWAAAVIYLVVAAVLTLRSEPSREGAAQPLRWQEAALWAMAFACAFLALYAHRWRNDDCYYINLAVTLADKPDAPLLATHTIHAPMPKLPGSNATFVPYRVHSFEALGGFISYLTGIEAIRVVHLGLGTAFALLVPFALAQLFAVLDRRRWFFMVVAAMCLLLFDGTSGLGFANQGIVRMFTGKSVLLSVALPVLVRSGIDFGTRPSRRGFVMLLASQITAVGLSSTALWLAPVAAMLAVIVPQRVRPAALRPILLGLLSCAYVLALALWVRAHLGESATAGPEDSAGAEVGADGRDLFRPRVGLVNYWLRLIFEEPRVVQAYLGLLLVSIPLARTALARRYLVAFTLVLALMFLNPFVAETLRLKVLGRFTGQRGIWVAPIPGAVAIAFTCLIPSTQRGVRRALGVLASGLLLLVFFTRVPAHAVFTPENDVQLRWPPGPKVPSYAFALGRELSATLPAGSQVLAPEVVSWYLPTLHRHVFPLLANAKYMSAGTPEEQRRKRMVRWVTERDDKFTKKEQDKFTAHVLRYKLAAVVLSRSAVKTKGLSDALKKADFRRSSSGYPGYQLWLPKKPAARGG